VATLVMTYTASGRIRIRPGENRNDTGRGRPSAPENRPMTVSRIASSSAAIAHRNPALYGLNAYRARSAILLVAACSGTH
jgi:hypothetical protein